MNLNEIQKQYILIEYQRLVDKMLELEKRILTTYLKNTTKKYIQ
jgi:hypothetical protein